VGTQSLESSQNLFDATRDLGKRILPGVPVTAGDTLWWVARQRISVPAVVSHLVTLAVECEVYGWFVHKISLASELPVGQERDALAQWLQRPVRPRRARVWVERPWAFAHSPIGIPVYRLDSEEWVIRSDQPVDITICPASGGEPVLAEEWIKEATWDLPRVGFWELRVNDKTYDLFEVVEAPTAEPHNLRVKVSGRNTESVLAAQAALDSARGRVCTIELYWQDEGIGRLIRPVGPARVAFDNTSARVDLSAGASVDLENLGRLARPLVEEVDLAASEAFAVLRTRAAWLHSVSSTGSQSERVVVPAKLQRDPIIRQLVGATWERRFAPHVRALQRLLGAWA